MSNLISKAALLKHLCKERDDYEREHSPFANAAKQEYLSYLDDQIGMIERFPTVEPVATLINNNQPGWTNIIETAPSVTIDVGTKLYVAPSEKCTQLSDERIEIDRLARAFGVSPERAKQAQDDLGFMYRKLASKATPQRTCGHGGEGSCQLCGSRPNEDCGRTPRVMGEHNV